jgi:hypothetical protein
MAKHLAHVKRRAAPLNGELSRPGHIAEQVVKTKYFQKPIAPRVGWSVLLDICKLHGFYNLLINRMNFKQF